jgi:hypothetical protein
MAAVKINLYGSYSFYVLQKINKVVESVDDSIVPYIQALSEQNILKLKKSDIEARL